MSRQSLYVVLFRLFYVVNKHTSALKKVRIGLHILVLRTVYGDTFGQGYSTCARRFRGFIAIARVQQDTPLLIVVQFQCLIPLCAVILYDKF